MWESQELVKLLREQNGEKSSAMLRALLHGTLWLSRDRFAWQAARLRGLALDMGEGFSTSFEQSERWVAMRCCVRCLRELAYKRVGINASAAG